MGNSLSLCGTCNVDINTVEALQREQNRINDEILRLQERTQKIYTCATTNLLQVNVKISEIDVKLATIINDIKHIKHEE